MASAFCPRSGQKFGHVLATLGLGLSLWAGTGELDLPCGGPGAQRPPHLPGTARRRMCAEGTPLPPRAPHLPLRTPCPGEMPMPQPPHLPGARHGVLSASANNKTCSGKKRKSHLAPLHHSPFLNAPVSKFKLLL